VSWISSSNKPVYQPRRLIRRNSVRLDVLEAQAAAAASVGASELKGEAAPVR